MCIHIDNIYKFTKYTSVIPSFTSAWNAKKKKKELIAFADNHVQSDWVLPNPKSTCSTLIIFVESQERDISTGQYTWSRVCYWVYILVTDIIQAHRVYLNKGEIRKASIFLL